MAHLALSFFLGLLAGAGIGYKYGSRAISKVKMDLASIELDVRGLLGGAAQNAADRLRALASKL